MTSDDERPTHASMQPEAKCFARCARRYCDLIGHHEETPIRTLLASVHQLLPQLYALGLGLPEIDSSDDPWKRDLADSLRVWTRVRGGLHRRLGHRKHYMKVFDSCDRADRASMVGLLDVDLADIYVDLAEGLRIWDAGDRADAVWQWRWGATYHWGDKATDAIKALHWLKADYAYRQPPPMPPS